MFCNVKYFLPSFSIFDFLSPCKFCSLPPGILFLLTTWHKILWRLIQWRHDISHQAFPSRSLDSTWVLHCLTPFSPGLLAICSPLPRWSRKCNIHCWGVWQKISFILELDFTFHDCFSKLYSLYADLSYFLCSMWSKGNRRCLHTATTFIAMILDIARYFSLRNVSCNLPALQLHLHEQFIWRNSYSIYLYINFTLCFKFLWWILSQEYNYMYSLEKTLNVKQLCLTFWSTSYSRQ